MPLNPALFDIGMAYYPGGKVCRVCDTTPEGNHGVGCPVPWMEKLEFRVEACGDSRGYRRTEGTGTDLFVIADELQTDDRMFWELGFSRMPARDIPYVTVTLSAEVPLDQVFRDAVDEARVRQEAEENESEADLLTVERGKRIKDIDSQREMYTALGYASKIQEILGDPRYKDLPPLETP